MEDMKGNYRERLSIRKPHGHFSMTDNIDGDHYEGDTLQCCHCGFNWIPVKGSGIQRGFCRNCMQVTCGKLECTIRCLPQEKMLEEIEKKAGIINRIRGQGNGRPSIIDMGFKIT